MLIPAEYWLNYSETKPEAEIPELLKVPRWMMEVSLQDDDKHNTDTKALAEAHSRIQFLNKPRGVPVDIVNEYSMSAPPVHRNYPETPPRRRGQMMENQNPFFHSAPADKDRFTPDDNDRFRPSMSPLKSRSVKPAPPNLPELPRQLPVTRRRIQQTSNLNPEFVSVPPVRTKTSNLISEVVSVPTSNLNPEFVSVPSVRTRTSNLPDLPHQLPQPRHIPLPRVVAPVVVAPRPARNVVWDITQQQRENRQRLQRGYKPPKPARPKPIGAVPASRRPRQYDVLSPIPERKPVEQVEGVRRTKYGRVIKTPVERYDPPKRRKKY
jgi:hypothetical protein